MKKVKKKLEEETESNFKEKHCGLAVCCRILPTDITSEFLRGMR